MKLGKHRNSHPDSLRLQPLAMPLDMSYMTKYLHPSRRVKKESKNSLAELLSY